MRSNYNMSYAAAGDTYNTVPRPCPSLIARLNAPENKFIFSRERNADMKSVDQTVTKFKPRFNGLSTEHWIKHLDQLELDRAKKHNWTAKQYYYGLRATLQARALTTIKNMEQDLDRPAFADLIPDWFQPSAEEWRDIATGRGLFSTFSERTKTAVIIVYFHFRFQRSSGDSAYSDFIYSAQAKEESVEDWGIRLDMLVEVCQKFADQYYGKNM